MAVTVTLPDGAPLELPDGATGADAAKAIGPGLARAALAVEVSHPEAGGDAEVRDLARPLPDGAHIAIITPKSGARSLELIRHDAAHVLATAVMELYPGVKISIGPPIEDGFYYDFEFPDGTVVSEADFAAIEARMRAHIEAAEAFERAEVSPAQARERFAAEGQDYKVELIDDLVVAATRDHPLKTVSLYTNGPFTDLCRGPHAPSTGSVGAFKLQSVAGAYWRGDSTRTMLTRIYGTAFFRGADLADLWRSENRARGYREVRTPILYDVELFRQSGHWEKYRDNMYFTEVETRPMGLKPMNCPAHIQIFNEARRSYRDLPIRLSEAGLVHRHEPSGVLHGLLRVRHITQDDAHIFCTDEQVEQEVVECLRFGFELYELFGFKPRLELSTRPPRRIGTDEMWDRAEPALAGALEALGLEYELNPGDGAFYGPKIDLHMTDSIGRPWQLGTVQLDYAMPERFGMLYTGADNAEHRPAMIHRALLGSFERFIGILIEHYAGEFPLWLAPVQAIVLPVSDRFNEYAASVAEQLRADGARVELDDRSESVARKIREAELRKIPYMLVVGEREQQEGTVAVREHRAGDSGSQSLQEFGARLRGGYTRPR
jgi:threonyl-tRNA synthetase